MHTAPTIGAGRPDDGIGGEKTTLMYRFDYLSVAWSEL
jgi:hypothetical protein